MPEPTPHAGFREKVHASFARQGLMKTFGGRLVLVEAGHVQIELPFSERLTQQHGYFHAAAVAAIADNAGGYAALTLMRPDEEVVAAEFKVNLLRPAVGARLVADASVVRAGRFLVVSQVTVSAFENDASIPVAMMLQTNFRVPADDDHRRVAGRPRRPVSSASSASSVVAYFSRDKGQSAMTTFQIILRRFEQPDETREFEKGRFELVRIGGVVIGRATYAPGWKWSEHVGPKVGAARCHLEHLGLVLAGTAVAAFDDGRVVELRPGTLFHIPAVPHDSWVVGEEPYVSLHFIGGEAYARPRG